MVEDVINRILSRTARRLRSIASVLDGHIFIDERWHRSSVEAVNKYVGQAERYICDLEDRLDPEVVTSLLEKHGRFSTKELLNAGAWGLDEKDSDHG